MVITRSQFAEVYFVLFQFLALDQTGREERPLVVVDVEADVLFALLVHHFVGKRIGVFDVMPVDETERVPAKRQFVMDIIA